MSTSPVVVTGMGMVTPLGADRLSGWQALLRGESAVGPVRRFDASAFPTTFAAEVPSLPGEDQAALKLRLVMDALEEALIGSGELPYAPERIGISMGSEAARPSLETVARRHRSGVVPTASELLANAADAPARALARRLGVTGPCTTISTACTSSAQAVGEGWQRLRRGEVDAMVVGGGDVLVGPLMLTGFSLLGALSTRNEDPQAASRPFDMDRDGFVLGEGAGVLESSLAVMTWQLATISRATTSQNSSNRRRRIRTSRSGRMKSRSLITMTSWMLATMTGTISMTSRTSSMNMTVMLPRTRTPIQSAMRSLSTNHRAMTRTMTRAMTRTMTPIRSAMRSLSANRRTTTRTLPRTSLPHAAGNHAEHRLRNSSRCRQSR